jgi:dihydroorotate dehydrogenase
MSALDAMWPAARAALFSMDAEKAHHFALRAMSSRASAAAARGLRGDAPEVPTKLFGRTLSSPVGLAAGLDKDGLAIPVWAALGFGFVEVGTVTAHPQPGNPLPRLFRLPEDRGIINRMGFNNLGSEALAARLSALRDAGDWPDIPVIANIGKSKITENERAAEDYATSVRRLRGRCDGFTVNISSPNTPGLRALQDAAALRGLLPAIRDAAPDAPIGLKLSPDLEDGPLEEAIEIALACGISAIIATNTTISRPDGLQSAARGETGGLSGDPLWTLARDRVAATVRFVGGRVPVIGVGGISNSTQVRELLALGCTAVQLYTALIYEGPGLPARLRRELVRP